MRDFVLANYDGIDLYEWYVHGEIIYADTVHHIIPAKEMDAARFYDPGNLIPVSDKSHREIHAEYSAGNEQKEKMQEKLYAAIREWNRRKNLEK